MVSSARSGDRAFEAQDRPHDLTLRTSHLRRSLLLVRCLGFGLVKIGISGDLKNRLKALNISFPRLQRLAEKQSEKLDLVIVQAPQLQKLPLKLQQLKDLVRSRWEKEFFIMEMEKAELLFNKLSPVSGLDLRVRGRRSSLHRS